MTLVDALSSLASMGNPVFETRDAAARLGIAPAHASTILARLEAARHIVRLRRGVWAFADGVDPLALPEHLTSPLPSYVSLQTALYLHGMISQVPAVTVRPHVSLGSVTLFAIWLLPLRSSSGSQLPSISPRCHSCMKRCTLSRAAS